MRGGTAQGSVRVRGGRARRPRPPPPAPPAPGAGSVVSPALCPLRQGARLPLSRRCGPPGLALLSVAVILLLAAAVLILRLLCGGGGALLFLHPAPHTPPRPREPSAGMINTVCVAGRAPGPRPPPWNLGPLELGPGQDGRSGGGGGPDAPAMAQRTRTMCTCGRTRSPWSLSACNRVAPVGKVAWDPGGWGGG